MSQFFLGRILSKDFPCNKILMIVNPLSSFYILTCVSPKASIRLIIFEAEGGSCYVDSMIRFCVNSHFYHNMADTCHCLGVR